MLIKGMIVALTAIFGSWIHFGSPSKLPACAGCKQFENAGGSSDFSFLFTPNPEPLIGQTHGDGECDFSCDQDRACKINGTLFVDNNSTSTVKVRWSDETGGIQVPPNLAKDFSAGFREQMCDTGSTQRIVVMDGSSLVAWYDFLCSSCEQS